MSYLAIARKWRPHKFDDLVGQSHVVQTLKNAILYNRVSHAYLFSGARGIGKTSVARIFAKTLRCPNSKDAIPCNECTECTAISESRSVDVVEIDGASNNGVEAVRGIRENVVYGASSGQYKIYIIDEVHMLSLSAFNALLKTLEEPPAHVLFIFATTEVQKIPLTIVSRCQRFEFRRLTSSQIVERLKYILAAEKVTISEEGLRAMAGHSDGSLRDALSLLDQVLSYFGSEPSLEEKHVVEALGISESNAVRDFLSAILKQDIKAVLSSIADTYFAGIDLKHFAERCLEELRLLYLVVLARVEKQALSPDELDISVSHHNEIVEMTKNLSVLQLERMSQILSRTIGQLSWSGLPRYTLEMAAVRMSKLEALEELESLKIKPQAAAVIPESVQPVAPKVTESIRPPRADSPQENTWKAFVDAVMKKRPLLGALLSHANFRMEIQETGKGVHLAFTAGSFYEKQAMDIKNRTEIENQLKTFFGPATVLILSNELNSTARSLEQTKQAETAAIKKQALEHPTVLKMKEMLGAEIVDVNIDS